MTTAPSTTGVRLARVTDAPLSVDEHLGAVRARDRRFHQFDSEIARRGVYSGLCVCVALFAHSYKPTCPHTRVILVAETGLIERADETRESGSQMDGARHTTPDFSDPHSGTIRAIAAGTRNSQVHSARRHAGNETGARITRPETK